MTTSRWAGGFVFLLVLAGCAGTSHPAAAPNTSAPARTAAPAQLTVGQARASFAAFLPKFQSMASNPALIPQVTIGPELAAQSFARGRAGFPPGQLSGELFLVPDLTSYPRWYLVAGSKSSGQGIAFLMVQQSASTPWRAAAELYDLSPPFQIVHDLSLAGFRASGVFTAASSDDTTLSVAPRALSADYARYVNSQGQGRLRRMFFPGTYTTGYLAENARAMSSAGTTGWHYAETQRPSAEPMYALDMPSGGALVLFTTKVTDTWTAMSSTATAGTSLGSPPSPLLQRLGVSATRAGLKVSYTVVEEVLALVGPGGTRGVVVIANDGKAVGAAKA